MKQDTQLIILLTLKIATRNCIEIPHGERRFKRIESKITGGGLIYQYFNKN